MLSLNFLMHTNSKLQSLRKSLVDFFGSLRTQLLTALSVGVSEDQGARSSTTSIDTDFEGWLHGDPSVTKNPASRYGDRTPGYITGNGLGSMEIGAADD